MGTDYERGFPADGEGPVRPVSLSAFDIDTYPVTNADFAAFVAATNFRTEAEVFGWSFVFWSHIPAERFEELVEDTAAPTPWWCKVPGATWKHPLGPGSDVEATLNHPSFMFRGTMLQPTQHGHRRRFQPRRNGSTPRVVASNRNYIPGETN